WTADRSSAGREAARRLRNLRASVEVRLPQVEEVLQPPLHEPALHLEEAGELIDVVVEDVTLGRVLREQHRRRDAVELVERHQDLAGEDVARALVGVVAGLEGGFRVAGAAVALA